MLVLIIGAGILAGAFFGVFGEELKIDESMLKVGYENSTVYDADGNQIAVLSGGEKRKSISLSDMSEYLPKAYVAIEDERFYKHSGIDIMRTARATLTYILHFGKSSFGGSTITQQVIKNITQEKDRTALAGVMRKVKEISKSIQVERVLSKDQILELYLNLIFVGGDDINGVELGSIYYFDKSAKDLSIAECAYMAGINHSPNRYKPFSDFADKENPEAAKQKMTNRIKKRTKTVLGKMKELEYITDDQYNEAVAEVDNGLHFQKGDGASVTTDVSYVTAAAIDQIIDQWLSLEENKDADRKAAELYLYNNGLKIYTTQKTDIQTVLEEEIVKKDYWSKGKAKVKNKEGKWEEIEQDSTPTMVIQDFKTGQVVAAATATGPKDERIATTKLGYFNVPTKSKKQTGSSMKPISVIAPGLITGRVTGATVYFNSTSVWGANGSDPWRPKNSTTGDPDYCNMRRAIVRSYNIPHAKALTNIGVEAAIDFCQKVGLPEFKDEGLSLALGGLSEGISPADMAGAYSAIANDGVYITPTYYTKVTDSKGNVLFEPKQEETEAMSPQLAYIEKDILKGPVIAEGGTATYCNIKGIDTAAKTGTTNDDYDRWLCGFTPYYAAATWYGFDKNATVKGFSHNPAGYLWAAVMKEIHEDLPNAKFEEPEGIVKQSICKLSGKLPGAGCTDIYTELFTKDIVPTETCEGHAGYSICNDSQMRATEFCPNVTPVGGYIPEYERGNTAWVNEGRPAVTMPEQTCTIHTAAAATEVPQEPQQHTHIPGAWIPNGDGTQRQVCAECGQTINTSSGGGTTPTTPPTNTNTPTDPGTTKPGTTDPGTTDPGTTKPGTTDPGTTDPGTTKPGTTDPGTTDPGTTKPGTTDPGTTPPGTTDPGTTPPGTTTPGT